MTLFVGIVDFVVVMSFCVVMSMLERRTMALQQQRDGPVCVGWWGVVQPVVDGGKLLVLNVVITDSVWRVVLALSCVFVVLVCGVCVCWCVLAYCACYMCGPEVLFVILCSFIAASIGEMFQGVASVSRFAVIAVMRMFGLDLVCDMLWLLVLIVCGSCLSYCWVHLGWVGGSIVWTEGLLFAVGLLVLLFLLIGLCPPLQLVCECEPELVCGWCVDYGGFLFMCSWLALSCKLIALLMYLCLGLLLCSGGLCVEFRCVVFVLAYVQGGVLSVGVFTYRYDQVFSVVVM